MSQVITFGNGSGAAPIETLTGNSGGAVGPTAGNINTIGGNNITVVGNPGTSTLTASVTGTTNHAVQVGNATGSLTSLAAATNGQLVIGSTGVDPVVAALTAGNNIGVTNGAGSISLAVTGTTNHSVQVGNASGSLTSLAAATNGQLVIGSTGVDPVVATLTAGSGVTITNGAGSITVATNADGFVTSTVQTTNATPTTLFSLTLGANNAANIFANVVGTISDYSATLVGTANGGARRAGAGAILIGSPTVNYTEDSAGAPNLDIIISGNNVIVQVTGIAAQTWNWRGLIQYVLQTV
jgi:hypothetical protein